MRPSSIRSTSFAGVFVLLASIGVAAAPAHAAKPIVLNHQPARIAALTPRPGLDILYDQRDNPLGDFIDSNNAPGPDTTDSSGADGFIVPPGQIWTVEVVDVVQITFGRIVSERVRFYLDSGHGPGAVIATIRNAPGHFVGEMLSIPLGAQAPTLPAGKYWVAVQGNSTGVLAWGQRTGQSLGPAAWENPRDGYRTDCETWEPLPTCVQGGGGGGDFMFALEGVA